MDAESNSHQQTALTEDFDISSADDSSESSASDTEMSSTRRRLSHRSADFRESGVRVYCWIRPPSLGRMDGRLADTRDLVVISLQADFDRIERHLNRGDPGKLEERIEGV